MLNLVAMGNNREMELEAALDAAKKSVPECDQILVIMQKKEGGYIFYAPEATKIETASFMAQQFLYHLHKQVEE